MSDQLHLLDDAPRWRLDPTTRERGRNGVARARAILERSRTKTCDPKLDPPPAEASASFADAA